MSKKREGCLDISRLNKHPSFFPCGIMKLDGKTILIGALALGAIYFLTKKGAESTSPTAKTESGETVPIATGAEVTNPTSYVIGDTGSAVKVQDILNAAAQESKATAQATVQAAVTAGHAQPIPTGYNVDVGGIQTVNGVLVNPYGVSKNVIRGGSNVVEGSGTSSGLSSVIGSSGNSRSFYGSGYTVKTASGETYHV